MTKSERLARVTELVLATERAHRQAFGEADGADPEWPIWYAEYLQRPLGELLGVAFTRSRLVHCLVSAEFERSVTHADAGRAEHYARHFVEHFAPADAPGEDTLILYHTESCPFCRLVRRAVDRLDIEVELRDVAENRSDREELVKARGRATVPVLRIVSPDGEERWMPESRDIVRYLERTYDRER